MMAISDGTAYGDDVDYTDKPGSRPPKVLLVGATGLIGRHLVRLLEQSGVDFEAPSRTALDLSRLTFDNLPLLPPATHILYLAQGRNYRDFPASAMETIQVNAFAPSVLLNHYASRGLQSFIYASSGNVYWTGERVNRGISEFPSGDIYSASKIAAEELLAPWRKLLPLGLVRIFTAYGEEAAASSLVAVLRERIMNKKPVTLNGPDGDIFQPTYAGDVARCLVTASFGQWSGAADIAGPERLSVREMAERMAARIETRAAFEIRDLKSRDFTSRGEALDEAVGCSRLIRFPGPL